MTQGDKGPNALHRLIYFSRAKADVAADIENLVRDVLVVSIARNFEVGVTGAMLACDGWFVQTLEGSRINVWNVYGRICKDRRHEAIKLIQAERVATRAFAQWSMCARCISPLDDAIVGTLETKKGFQPALLTAPAALRLLEAINKIQLRETPRIGI
jgi:hypothetical protein